MSLRARVAPAPPAVTVAEVLRVGLPDYARAHRLPSHHWRVLRAILACRTPELGGHLYQCSHCGERRFVPHSCRNRHCPTCQGANGYAWMQAQAGALLPIPYFHLVFTLPHALNPLIRQNQARCYELLFACASATLLEFGRGELQAQLGVTAVLHTWSQTLLDHYHLHCIVTGGGLREDGTWAARSPQWLFPVRALSAMFRGKFRAGLRQLYRDGRLQFHGQQQASAPPAAFAALVDQATRPPWVVYAKRPFAGPEVVLAYLARYTHRVGITNHRLLALDQRAHTVRFAYKDYAEQSRSKALTLACAEFVRRLQLHLLPERFVKIRHYGLLANRNRRTRIAAARAAMPAQAQRPDPPAPAANAETVPEVPIGLPACCPHCHQQADWILVERLAPPPGLPGPVPRFLVMILAPSSPLPGSRSAAAAPAVPVLWPEGFPDPFCCRSPGHAAIGSAPSSFAARRPGPFNRAARRVNTAPGHPSRGYFPR